MEPAEYGSKAPGAKGNCPIHRVAGLIDAGCVGGFPPGGSQARLNDVGNSGDLIVSESFRQHGCLSDEAPLPK